MEKEPRGLLEVFVKQGGLASLFLAVEATLLAILLFRSMNKNQQLNAQIQQVTAYDQQKNQVLANFVNELAILKEPRVEDLLKKYVQR